MAHAENEVVIQKSVTEVFNFLADGSNNTKWRPGVIRIELRSGQDGQLGAEYRQLLKGPGGRPIDGDYRLISLEPNKEIGFAVIAGPARPTGLYSFTSDGNSTQVHIRLSAKRLNKINGPDDTENYEF